jgi:hypothetical protein
MHDLRRYVLFPDELFSKKQYPLIYQTAYLSAGAQALDLIESGKKKA